MLMRLKEVITYKRILGRQLMARNFPILQSILIRPDNGKKQKKKKKFKKKTKKFIQKIKKNSVSMIFSTIQF